MKNNDLNNKTIEQLQSNLRVKKAISILLVIALVLFTAITIFGLITKEDTAIFIALFAVACSCWSFLPISFYTMKKIKTELKLRDYTDQG